MGENPANMHEGMAVRMGGRDWIVPALNMRQVRYFEEKGALTRAFEVGPLSPPEDRSLALEIIHAAMGRNYPDLTVEVLEELLDLNNTPKVFLSIMGLSGLTEKGERPAGELTAGASSGTISSPTLSHRVDLANSRRPDAPAV